MKLNLFKQRWGDLRLENIIGRVTIPVLAIALAVAVFYITNLKPVVTVLPPNMNGPAEIAYDDANEATKKAYGVYVINMLSNVHPGNVKFMIASLEGALHPSVYHEARESLMDQVQRIKDESLSITFEPRSVDYWPDTNRVVVQGRRVTEGRVESNNLADMMTYEVEVEISSYMPQITYINSYQGRPERRR